jgi:hypothetical protein
MNAQRRTQTERNRTATPAIIYGIAVVLLLLPVSSAYGEWQHLLRYGWPGPYTSDIAEFNAGETEFKVLFWAIPSVLVLLAAVVGAGFAARAAGQRVWLVILVGVIVTVLVLAGASVLLTTPLASYAA